MDLGLDQTTVFLDVGVGSLCDAVARACLSEGANLAIASTDLAPVGQIKARMPKSFGLRIRGHNIDPASPDSIAAMIETIDRLAAPVAGLVAIWSDNFSAPAERWVGPAATIAAVLDRSTPSASLVFLDTATILNDDPTSEDLQRLLAGILNWKLVAGSRRRVNLVCVGGSIDETVPAPSNDVWDPRGGFPQTFRKALGSWVAFILSPSGSYFDSKVMPFRQTGLVV